MPTTFIEEMLKKFRGFEPPRSKKPEPSPLPGSADQDALYRSVQDRSYYLWKEAGEPEGRADEFWRRSLDEHLSQRAEEIWEREGHPRGRENEHWYQACRDLERAGLLKL